MYAIYCCDKTKNNYFARANQLCINKGSDFSCFFFKFDQHNYSSNHPFNYLYYNICQSYNVDGLQCKINFFLWDFSIPCCKTSILLIIGAYTLHEWFNQVIVYDFLICNKRFSACRHISSSLWWSISYNNLL